MKNEPQLSAENPQDAFTTEQAYQEYEQFVEMIKREGSMNTPCKKCNELNKPCCDEHSGKIAEPQLSAEMEKRLMDLLPLGLDDWLVEDIKHFLATALEEQKEEVIEELLKHMRKVMFERHGTGWAMVDDYKERFLNRKDTNE